MCRLQSIVSRGGAFAKRWRSLQNYRPLIGTRGFSEGIAGRPSRGARCQIIVVISVLRDGLRVWIARLAFEWRKSSNSGTDHSANVSALVPEAGLWHTGFSGG